MPAPFYFSFRKLRKLTKPFAQIARIARIAQDAISKRFIITPRQTKPAISLHLTTQCKPICADKDLTTHHQAINTDHS